MSVRAPVGPTNLCPEKSCIGRGLAAIRPNENKMLTQYLLFFLKHFETEIEKQGKGSTFSAITKTQLENLGIPLPSIEKQKYIIKKLNDSLNKVENSIMKTKDNFQKLHSLKKSLLNSAFQGKQ